MNDFPEEKHSDTKEEKFIHATSISPKESVTVFQRFKTLAKQLFNPKEESLKVEMQLKGRIQALQQTASKVVSELTAIKEDLANQADPDLVGTIESVVNHHIRDIMRIEKKMARSSSIEEKIEAVERCSEWIDRAKPWVHLLGSQKDRHVIIQAVVKHTIHASEETIKRDLQVIKDYQEHKLVEMSQGDEGRSHIEKRLEEALRRPVDDLTTLLRNEPIEEEVGLGELEAWKQKVDDLRKRYYNTSMNAIDGIFQDIHPSIETPEEHSQVVSNLARMAIIEEKLADLQASMKSPVYDEEEIGHSLEEQEKEVFILSKDITHTPEITERLFKVNYTLTEIRERLQGSG